MGRVGEGHDLDDALRVLVVEDNERLCDLFATWLSDRHDVAVAHDGDEALQAFDPAIDVLLLDRRMPAMAGDEVLATVRSRGWDGQAVMVSAADPAADVIDLEIDDYLIKPVTREELLAAIETLQTVRTLDPEMQEYVRLLAKRRVIEDARGPVGEVPPTDPERSAYEALLERIQNLERSIAPDVRSLGIDVEGLRMNRLEEEPRVTERPRVRSC